MTMNKSTLIALGLIIIAFGGLFFAAQNGNNGGGAKVAITAEDWTRGASSPKVTIIEYGDFQCPACGAYEPLFRQAQEDFKDSLLFAYRHFPLVQIHPNALLASKACEAAGKQGKFWEMHDLLFEKQTEWSNATNAKDLVKGYAASLALDATRFATDLDSKEIEEKIRNHYEGGAKVGVSGTPSLFVNGEKVTNPRDYQELKRMIEDAIEKGSVAGGASKTYHIHADFKAYVNGKALDFSSDKYQSTKEAELDAHTHFHDKNSSTIHIHKEGITLRYFLNTFGIVLTSGCLRLDTGEQYCEGQGKDLALYVNGIEVKNMADYEVKDLDRILLTYGTPSAERVATELTSVTDTACIYSETCPERGTPPTEECVGGLGTTCEE